jgi:SAM-dependent methyltransferase
MKSNIEWQKWGEHDPLYAVATWEGKERGSKTAWTDSDFYELGRSDWADFVKHWQRYGLSAGDCLEIGCGAGRITRQLVQYFNHVTGVDVSQHQLDYARDRICASNVTFTISNGTHLPVGDQALDAVFSAHVFQHFESHSDAFAVFREIYRALIDGGTMMIHLPLFDFPHHSKAAKLIVPIISLEDRLIDFKAGIDRRKLRKGKWRPVMKYLRFERSQLIGELQNIGFSDIEFCMFALQSNHAYHEFLFAAKRAPRSG